MSVQNDILAKDALKHWPALAATPRLLHQRENTIFEIRFQTGLRAVLRLHRAGLRSRKAIEAELRWISHLSERRLAVPTPLPARNGAFCVAIEQGRCASVMAWVDGTPLFSVENATHVTQVARLGGVLAAFHSLADEVAPPSDRPNWRSSALLGDTPNWGRFWEAPDLAPEEAKRLKAARSPLREALSNVGFADLGMIHGDLLPDNVLATQNQLTLIDFDDCGPGYRGYDLGTALISLWDAPDFAASCGALATAYAAGRGIEVRRVREALPLFVALRAVASVGWAAGRTAPGDLKRRAYIARALACLSRWEEAS